MLPTAGGTTGTTESAALVKKNGGSLRRVAAHLLRVLGVVAADAIDMAHRKAVRPLPSIGTGSESPRNAAVRSWRALPALLLGIRLSRRRRGGEAAAPAHAARWQQRRIRREIEIDAARIGELRHEADVGDLGAPPWQNSGLSVAGEPRLQRFETDVDQ